MDKKNYRKTSLIVITMFILLSPQISYKVFAQSNGCSYLSFKKNGKWGYVDRTGQIVISPKFDLASDFDGERAIAQKDRLWGIINK